MTVVLVHGLPETAAVWDPLRSVLPVVTHAVALPGFGVPRPAGFSGTKDAYAEWLATELAEFPAPLDLVAHDLGALLVMRLISSGAVTIRSWVVDVAELFHPSAHGRSTFGICRRPGSASRFLPLGVRPTRTIRKAQPLA